MKQYMTNAINTSPTRVGIAAAVIETAGGKAVKFDTNGEIVICSTKGEKPIGIITIDNDTKVAIGDDVTYQIFGVGVAVIGEAIKAGDELTVNADGALVKAAANDFVCAVALKECTKDALGTVEMVNYYKVVATETVETDNKEE